MMSMDFWSVIQVLILSLVEGLTEFLPVSSTGHLILASRLMGLAETDFVVTFNIVIQLAAVLAIVWLYRQKLLQGPRVWKNIIIAFIPTGIIALTVYRLVREMLLVGDLSARVTVASLFIGGVVILLLEKYYFPQRLAESEMADIQIEDLSVKQALTLGVVQVLAVIPGVSRSASTIFGGMALGLSRKTAAEFSFLLAIPTMTAASGYDLLKSGATMSAEQFGLLAIGFVASFGIALVVVKLFLKFVQSNTFAVFGWYRIVVAVAFWLLVLR